MEVRQTIEIDRPVSIVWAALGDIPLIAECLPGAKLTQDLGDGRYKGTVAIKLGPVSANFSGEASLSREPETYSGRVVGKGADGRTSSRAQAEMDYRVLAVDEGRKTRIEIVAKIVLSGMLAQFGKAAVVNEIAARLAQEFAGNLRTRLVETPDPSDASDAAPAVRPDNVIKADRLFVQALWACLVAWFKRVLRFRSA